MIVQDQVIPPLVFLLSAWSFAAAGTVHIESLAHSLSAGYVYLSAGVVDLSAGVVDLSA